MHDRTEGDVEFGRITPDLYTFGLPSAGRTHGVRDWQNRFDVYGCYRNIHGVMDPEVGLFNTIASQKLLWPVLVAQQVLLQYINISHLHYTDNSGCLRTGFILILFDGRLGRLVKPTNLWHHKECMIYPLYNP